MKRSAYLRGCVALEPPVSPFSLNAHPCPTMGFLEKTKFANQAAGISETHFPFAILPCPV